MSDPLPTSPNQASATGDADRESRIEQLLLTGLDHYFGGQFEQAISVWTRVVFLDRHHDRARAYIERARSAMAERQREIEELVHSGVQAYESGDAAAARDLLTRAAASGSDTAHVFLDRLNRVGAAAVVTDAPVQPAAPRTPMLDGHRFRRPSRGGLIAAVAGTVLLAIVMLLGGLPIGTWLSELQGAPEPTVQAPPLEPLPVVRASEA